MKIDLNCPVEVWRCQLPRSPEEPCEITLFNLGDRPIVSAEIMLIFVDAEGKEIQRLVDRRHDLDGQPAQSFAALLYIPPEMLIPRPDRIEVTVEKAWFSDGIVWRKNRANLIEYTPNALRRGRSLNTLRYIAGEDAIGYPQLQDSCWLCVCGRPNALDTESCARCGRVRSDVFTNFNQEAVRAAMARQEERLAQNRGEADRLGSGERDDHIVRRKDPAVIAVWVLAAAVLILGVILAWRLWLRPLQAYNEARALLEKGQWEEADAAFAAMPGYRDAEDQRREIRYRRAVELAAQGEYEQSEAMFSGLGSYKDSLTQAREVRYQRALDLMQGGSNTAAKELFEQLGRYRDSEDRAKECDYIRAQGLLTSGRWEDAYAAFAALGDYADADDKRMQSFYLPGVQALAAGDPDTALTWLSRNEIADYADTAELRKQALYTKGMALLEAGDVAAAGRQFAEAGDYLDAANKARECIYTPARNLQEAQRWAEAAELFEKIPEYLDSHARWRVCLMAVAQERIEADDWVGADETLRELAKEDADAAALRWHCIYMDASVIATGDDWTGALARLAELPEDCADAEAAAFLTRDCSYHLAMAAARRFDFAGAVASFESLGAHRDSEARAQAARYQAAQASFNDESWEDAAAGFESLGAYRDAPAKAQLVRYQEAMTLENAGDTVSADRACQIYESLGAYRDAADRVWQLRYSVAERLLISGDYSSARERFLLLEDYADSAERVFDCDYALAESKLAEGDRDAAAQAFMTIADYRDAAERANMLWYEMAGEAEAAGSLTRACALYTQLGPYRDSAERAEETRALRDAYSVPQAQAQAAIDAGNWAAAAWILDGLVRQEVPAEFADLTAMHRQACTREAQRLLAGDERLQYAAYPYLQRLADDPELGPLAASRMGWRLLGTWLDEEGNITLTFRYDGTMTVNGAAHRYTCGSQRIAVDGVQTYSIFQLYQASDGTGVTDRMVLRDLLRAPDVVTHDFHRVEAGAWEPLPEVPFTAGA